MTGSLGIIGVPTSAGAFAPGQEKAPGALRALGLADTLRSVGVRVNDHGDCRPWPWRPDRSDRRAQNLASVVGIVRDTARRVEASADRGEISLVLGGDCTVGLGTVAGHLRAGGPLGLVYFDAHADLNIPDSVPEGALDWMGLAHMLGEPGARAELVAAGPHTPMLEPGHVVLLGWDPAQATETERATITRRAITTLTRDAVAEDPEGAARSACGALEACVDRYLVHFDVDVIDFVDAPLSENPGRNEGLPYETTMRALRTVMQSPRFAGLTVTELNPDHASADPSRLQAFVSDLASCLGHALARHESVTTRTPYGPARRS
jgi:arginase